uniref:uncharacterized protein LOC122604600 n=1 Tax=Erigeron canadensis TaxID=72917 RepID=UPI001CB920F5|nr:uncharacterized protein LOC122604600 [Erigeron canadensis]
MDPNRIRKPNNDPKMLLRLSEHFLQRRHFSDCHIYATQVQEIDPHFPGVNQILAVAAVLHAAATPTTGNLTDWYKILQLERYTNNSELITEKFNKLYDLLNPSKNEFPFSDEAFDVVCDAWFLLSNSVKKLEFDENLLKNASGVWTICPYCYYVYEYDKEYLDCCLECENDKCGKAFTCVEIGRPPVEVLRAGEYLCGGFLLGKGTEGGWNPFLCKGVARDGNECEFVEISSDEGKVKVEDEVCKKKVNGRRLKSVAKRTKKVTGLGKKVRKETKSEDDSCEDVEGTVNVDGLDFCDGGDDVLVSVVQKDQGWTVVVQE